MNDDRNDQQQQNDVLFEVAFSRQARHDKNTSQLSEFRTAQHNMTEKLEKYRKYSEMFPHINQIQMRQDDIIIALPDNVYAKYILKSISYLADEWITLSTSFIRQGTSAQSIVIDMEQVDEEQIANLCSELNECIDHFVARAAGEESN